MAGHKPGDPMWGMPAGSLAKNRVAPLALGEEDNVPCTDDQYTKYNGKTVLFEQENCTASVETGRTYNVELDVYSFRRSPLSVALIVDAFLAGRNTGTF